MRSALAPLFAVAALGGACSEALPRALEDDAGAPVDAGAADAPPSDAADAGPVPKGGRTLGVAVGIDDVAFADQVRDVRAVGAGTTNAPFAWDDVERPEDGGAPVLFHPGLHVVGLVVSSARMQASLSLEAVDGSGPRLPVDLAGRGLDDPDVGSRYEAALDYVLGQTRDVELTALLVGSDVDRALGADAAKWSAFATFVGRAAAHAHAARPGVRVGFVLTSAGLAGEPRAAAGAALAASDVFAVSQVGDVTADLGPIVAAAPPGKPIVVHAVGRPSAPDEGAQAAFVRDVFASWDRHADRIAVLTFFELDDPAGASTTYGLRRAADGRAKPAFAVLAGEARARGF